jgi:hypothetical protein
MLKLVSPGKLTEGDWLEKEVKVGKITVRKTVHGLSFREIEILRRHKKKVLIKEGIPFVPVFLLALIAMVYVFLILSGSLEQLIFSLF